MKSPNRTASGRAAAVLACGLLAGLSMANSPAQAATTSGWNEWTCQPTDQHPRPVVLVHGLGANPDTDFPLIAPALVSAGYCVFSTTYGETTLGEGAAGFGPADHSAETIATFVDRVLTSTGAAQVDVVAHSEGTGVSAYYMKFLGGATKVNQFIGFGTNYAGTSTLDAGMWSQSLPLTSLKNGLDCVACTQFSPGSDFLEKLNNNGVSVAGPHYVNIVSTFDHLVTPYTSGIMSAAPNVTNIVLQQECPADSSGHLGLSFDPNIVSRIEHYLDPANAPRPGCMPYSSAI